MIAFHCPECEAELEVGDSHAGARIKCPDCGHRFAVPNRSRASAGRGPERGPRSSSAGRGKERPERPRREAPSPKPAGNATAIIIASVGGGIVLCAALIIGLMVWLRPKSDTASTPNNSPPVTVQHPGPPAVNPVATQVAQKTSKPAEEANAELAAGADSRSNVDSDQLIYEHLLKSVAWIVNLRGFNGAGQPEGSMGSGTLIDRDNRLVLTNEHVVHGEGNQILVFFPKRNPDGSLLAEREAYMKQARQEDAIHAKVLAKETRCDLAVIQLERVPDGVEALALAREPTRPGRNVHSIGNPGVSGALWNYTFGKVKSEPHHFKWRAGDENNVVDHEAQVVETQSPTNHGDSGGPLVNDRGELVAVTHGFSRSGQTVGLFIDVSEARAFIEKTCQQHGLLWNRSTRALVVHNAAGVPGLIRNLESTDRKVRGNAAQALGNAGSDARMAIQPLLGMLKNEQDELTRRLALEALKRIGAPERSDLEALREALNDSHPEVRGYAAGAIGLLGVDGQPALPDLLKLARAREVIVRQNAVRALGRIGPEYKDKVMPLIAEALKDSDRDVRIAAGEAVASIGSFTRDDIPVLTEILKHRDAQVQAFAASALGKMGGDARKVVPTLAEAFKDSSDKTVRRAVVEALASIGKSAKVTAPIYAEALRESDKEMRKIALEAVARLGADGEEAAPAVAELLSDGDLGTRKSAVRTLKKMGPGAKKAVTALAEALKDEDEDFVMDAVAALGAIGPDAKGAVTYMIRLFEARGGESSARVRHDRIAQAIAKIGKDAVKPLVVALEDPNSLVRIGAALTLGEMGTVTKSAQKALLLHYQADPHPQVQEACNIALQKIVVAK